MRSYVCQQAFRALIKHIEFSEQYGENEKTPARTWERETEGENEKRLPMQVKERWRGTERNALYNRKQRDGGEIKGTPDRTGNSDVEGR